MNGGCARRGVVVGPFVVAAESVEDWVFEDGLIERL